MRISAQAQSVRLCSHCAAAAHLINSRNRKGVRLGVRKGLRKGARTNVRKYLGFIP